MFDPIQVTKCGMFRVLSCLHRIREREIVSGFFAPFLDSVKGDHSPFFVPYIEIRGHYPECGRYLPRAHR